jgi:gliding motility-associated-like protein
VVCPDPNVTVSVAVQPQITMNDVPNILVCPGQSINPNDFVTTPAGGTFTWTNDNTSIGIAASGTGQIATWPAPPNNTSNTVSGTVTVSAQLNGCPGVQDVFTVSINPVPDYTYNLNPSSGISCLSPIADINGSVIPVGSTIVWSGPGIVSGQGTGSITINTPGNYSIVMTDPGTGCTATEVVQMDPPTQINITSALVQNITCGGASDGVITIITDNSSGVSYTWTPNAGNGSSVNGLSPGVYSVEVSNDDQCIDDSTFTITEPDPIVVSMIDSVGSECGEANGYLTVSATGGQGGFSYTWNNGTSGPTNSGIDSGNHTVTVTDAAGCSVDEVLDLGCTELIPIVVPQLITPNGDGKNDVWIIQNIQQYPEIKVWVYNRWGNLVYQSQPYNNDWNGYYTEGGNVNGPLPASTYFYLIDTMKKSQDPIKGYLEIQP